VSFRDPVLTSTHCRIAGGYVLLRLVGAGMRRLFRWSVAMAAEFLAVCFQVMMFALTFGLALAGYAWLVTP